MAIKALILDTSAYSAVQRGNREVANILNTAQQIYLPTIVVGELKAGFAFGTKRLDNERLLEKFMADPVVSVITLGDKTTIEFAEIYVQLRKDGKTIGQNDLWIAALARENQLPLLTLDKDFEGVDGLELVLVNK